MKAGYIVALLMIVLMVGCTTTQPEAAPAAPAETAPEAPPTQVEAPLETVPVNEAETELSDVDQIKIESLKAACERGALAVCLSLKNVYGIDWPPEVAEESAAEELIDGPPDAVEVSIE